MADLHVAAGAQREAQAALVALAGHDDPGDAASELDRAIVTLADEGHPRNLDELLAPAAGAALEGVITYRVDRHERGTLEPTDAEELPDVVVAVRRFLETAEGLRGDESVLLFSAADGVERLLASAVAEGPVRFHPPERASFSGDRGSEAFASWDDQLDGWAAETAQQTTTEHYSGTSDPSGSWPVQDRSVPSFEDPVVLRARIDDLEQQLAVCEAELSRLHGELARARDSGVSNGGSVRGSSSRRSGARGMFSRYRSSHIRRR